MTASAVAAHPAALHAYLRRATWGLPEGRRQELWDELEEHVLTRTEHLQFTGLSPTQALAQAIRELGPPARVTLGMAKVYTMPKLLIAAGTLALGISAGLYALAGGGGGTLIKLPVFNGELPKPSCVRGTVPSESVVTIVSQSKEDGTTCYIFKKEVSGGIYRFQPGSYVSETTITSLARAVNLSAIVDNSGFIRITKPASGESTTWRTTGIKDGVRYFPLPLIIQVIKLNSSVILSGYDMPSIRTPDADYSLGAVSGRDLYQNVGFDFLHQLDSASETNLGGVPRHNHQIRTRLSAGEVVMLLTRRGKQYTADYAPVGTGGVVKIKSYSPRISFTADPATVGQAPQDGVFKAILVRLTNIPLDQLKTGIFLPAQTTSDAR